MHHLNDTTMLNLWEQGLHQPPLHQAMILLSAALPDTPTDSLLSLSIGQRDRQLLQLRERLFGQQVLNTAVCPQCKERLEWKNQVADYLQPIDPEESLILEEEDYRIHFRLPNSLDIAAVLHTGNTETAERALLIRCLLQSEHAGVVCALEQLPEPVLHQLQQRIEAADPLAEIRIHLACPECSHGWDVLFDIISFLWAEITDWAERMLRTVHQLASGYGWSEGEILALNPVRRQLYLGMLGA